MPDHEKTIKVVDRRLFTLDGEIRDEVKAELEAPDEPAPTPAPALPDAPLPPETQNATSAPFLRLLDMLAQTASLYLEGIPDPATGRRHVDLNAARQIVDSLAALREKTRGRLSFEETDAVDGLIGELQLAFTRLTAPPRGRGPAPPETARRG